MAQSAHKSLRNGDMLYGYGKYSEAETEYRKAESAKSSVKSAYNLGNTLMNQERYDEAAKKYTDAAAKATTDKERANIYHNQGNALYKKQQYQESVNAYKQALKYNPDDAATKENMAIARRELKKQQQQQKDKQNQKNNDQNKDQKKDQQDKEKDQNHKDQQDKNDQENKDQQQQNDQSQENDKNKQPSDKKMSKQDAQKLLEIMDNEEKKVQQKMRRVDGKSKKLKKDW